MDICGLYYLCLLLMSFSISSHYYTGLLLFCNILMHNNVSSPKTRFLFVCFYACLCFLFFLFPTLCSFAYIWKAAYVFFIKYLKEFIWIGLWFLRRNDISLDWILQSLNKIDHSFNFCQFLLIFWWFSIFCTFSFSLIICHTIWYHYKSNFKY